MLGTINTEPSYPHMKDFLLQSNWSMCQVMSHAEVVRPVSPKFGGICEIMSHSHLYSWYNCNTERICHFVFHSNLLGLVKILKSGFGLQEGNNIIIILSGRVIGQLLGILNFGKQHLTLVRKKHCL